MQKKGRKIHASLRISRSKIHPKGPYLYSQPSKKIKIPQFLNGQNASQDSYVQVTNRPADCLFSYFFILFLLLGTVNSELKIIQNRSKNRF